jgi:DNA-binding Lrp family transcriptional regulator
MSENINNNITEEEQKLITALQKYSLRDIDLLTQHTGLSKQKIWRIIKKLEKNNIIWGYTTIIEEQKQNLQKFILLLKRTAGPITEETINNISNSLLEQDYREIGVTIESSFYIHGGYDWILIFTAKDLKHAKKLTDLLSRNHPGLIKKTELMQIMYSQRNCYVLNPNKKKLAEFI